VNAAPLCNPLTLTAAFVAGAAGSVHCVAMCGGITGALGMRSRRIAPPGRASRHAATYQLGRLASYTLAGALVGAFGDVLQAIFDLSRFALAARVMAGAVLICVAVGVLFGWRPLGRLERLGGRLWSRVAPLARRFPAAGLTGSLLLGMLWGWLPCGFVYTMLLFAATSGDSLQAAAMMLFFGLGTVPAVFAATLFSARVWRVTMLRGLNNVAGWLLLAFGALTVLGPLSPAHH
jgi:sulfite exporter TauE/SafE